jgi:hypothetical protein
MAVGHPLDEISPVPSPAFTTSRSPYTGGFLAVAFPGSSPLPWPSLTCKQLGSLLSRFRVAISVLQDSLYVAGCCFALPSQEVTTFRHTRSPRCTGCLLPGGLTGLPRAHCGVPGLDFHQQADDDFSGRTSRCWAAKAYFELRRIPELLDLIRAKTITNDSTNACTIKPPMSPKSKSKVLKRAFINP